MVMPRTRSRNRACSRPSARNCLRDAAAAPRPATAIASGTITRRSATPAAAHGRTQNGQAARSGPGHCELQLGYSGKQPVQSFYPVHDDGRQITEWRLRSRAGPA